MSEMVLYTSDDGRTQLEIAELFQTTKQNVSLHAKNIFEDGDLAEVSVVKESLTTASADAEDLRAIEDLEKDLKRKGGKA